MNSNMIVNKIKFPTFRYTHANHYQVKDEGLIKAFTELQNADTVNITNINSNSAYISHFGEWLIKNEALIVQDNKSTALNLVFNNIKNLAHRQKVVLKCGANAKIKLIYDLKEGCLIGGLDFELEADSKLELALVFLNGKDVVYDIHGSLSGEKANVAMEAAYFCSSNSKYDINLEINHIAKSTKSVLNMNGILDDGASKTYKYCLDFPRGAQNADGHEQENIVALGDNFKNITVPILLVGEDSIEASHGATLEEPDVAVLDYIQSRGIDKVMADFICVQAKLSPALDMLESKEKAYVSQRLEEIMRNRK